MKSRNMAHVQQISRSFRPVCIAEYSCSVYIVCCWTQFPRHQIRVDLCSFSPGFLISHLQGHADIAYRPVSLHGSISICRIAFASPHGKPILASRPMSSIGTFPVRSSEAICRSPFSVSSHLGFFMLPSSSTDYRVRRIVLYLLIPHLWLCVDPALAEFWALFDSVEITQYLQTPLLILYVCLSLILCRQHAAYDHRSRARIALMTRITLTDSIHLHMINWSIFRQAFLLPKISYFS